jgi:mevalonate kinase
MLFGEHAVVYGKPCLVTAVDQRMHASVKRVEGNQIELKAPNVDVPDLIMPVSEIGSNNLKGAQFVLVAVRNFFDKYKVEGGLSIETKSDFSSKFGFGSSSAVTVCVLKALAEVFDINLDNRQLFDIAYKTVLDIQGVGSGFDIAAAIWGGTLYFVGGGKKIEPVDSPILPLIVGYTGVKADTATLVRQVAKLHHDEPGKVEKIFSSIGKVVENARAALAKRDYKKLGILMNQNQELLDGLGVSSVELDNLISGAKDGGAYGAKQSGAGGGDCMIAFLADKTRISVTQGITEKGGIILDVVTGAAGVRVENT